jgi:hypothetical protein
LPYAFAHPAAVIPVAKLLGPRAVPSALAIGAMVPDAWYLVPFVGREHGHSLPGALWFCLPAALLAYGAFHLLFKEPLLALLPPRLAARLARWGAPGLPAVPWLRVVVSALAGIATHLVWDAFTHHGYFTFVESQLADGVPLYRVLQHASTVLGAAFLAWWLWRKLRMTPPRPDVAAAPPSVRLLVGGAMVVFPAIAFAATLQHFDAEALRAGARAGAVMAVSALGCVALCYSLLWRFSPTLRARPRPRARACAIAPPR